MREKAISIGKPAPLVGVVCEPENFDKSKPAVIIFNSGIMHHIGSCRLSVKIARELARQGIMSVRFDFSGIGDSDVRRDVGSFAESSAREAGEMMDFLQKRRGVNSFVLYGLCSGADAAYETALVDKRVVAISQIDPYCYRTAKFYFYYVARKLLNVRQWGYYFSRATDIVREKLGFWARSAINANDEFMEAPAYLRVFPPQSEIEGGLKKLLDRGVHMNVTVTGDEPAYIYRDQYRHSFGRLDFADLLDLHYFDDASHILTHPDHQTEIVQIIVGWYKKVQEKLA